MNKLIVKWIFFIGIITTIMALVQVLFKGIYPEQYIRTVPGVIFRIITKSYIVNPVKNLYLSKTNLVNDTVEYFVNKKRP